MSAVSLISARLALEIVSTVNPLDWRPATKRPMGMNKAAIAATAETTVQLIGSFLINDEGTIFLDSSAA